MKAAVLFVLALTGCGRYRDFSLPLQSGAAVVRPEWHPRSDPVLVPGRAGAWDSGDVLNPSVLKVNGGYLNAYSGFDGTTWRTGLAASTNGLQWTKLGPILSPIPGIEPDQYIAANGALVQFSGSLNIYYQAGRTPQIYLAHRISENEWRKAPGAVLSLGPYGSWDERGVADPYTLEVRGTLYMYYLGMDRARRQRLGVAMSTDGLTWFKLRSNPIMELGNDRAFDENGLGEPAVWISSGSYWMLYTGRARNERRRLGLARSKDGVHWEKLPEVIEGEQSWNSQVMCDPTVLVEGGRVRVWFGGGDIARPDENIHGRIGYGELILSR